MKKRVLAFLLSAGLSTFAFGDDVFLPEPGTVYPGDAASDQTSEEKVKFKWKGYISTGADVVLNGVDQPVAGMWAENQDWKNGGEFKLTGDFSISKKQGVKFSLWSDGQEGSSPTQGSSSSTSAFGIPVLKYAYAYSSFLNDMIYGQAGIIDYKTTTPQGDMQPCFTKHTPGAVVEVRPMEGLSVNAFAQPATAASGSASALQKLTKTPGIGNLYNSITALGADYALPHVFEVMGEAQFETTATSGNPYALSQATFGANLTSIPNLNIWLEGLLSGYNNFGSTFPSYLSSSSTLYDGHNDEITQIAETISYRLKDLGLSRMTVGLVSYQFFYGSDLKNIVTSSNSDTGTWNPSYKLTPWVSYAFDGGIVPMLSFTYFYGAEALGDSFFFWGSNYGDNVMNTSGAVLARGNYNNVATIEIKPSVQLKLGSGQTVTFVYALEGSVGPDPVYYRPSSSSTAPTSTATIEHIFQVDYVLEF